MRVPGTLCAAGVGHHAVGANVVAPAHDGDKGRYAILVGPYRGDIGIGFFAREKHIYLGTVRADGLQQAGQGTVCVRSHHQVHLFGFQEFIFEAFGHAPYDTHQHVRLLFPGLVEHLYPAPDALFGVVPHGAGVGHHQVGLLHLFRPFISSLCQDGEDHFRVVHVHLAAVCLNVYFLHNPQRYAFSG